MNSSADIDECNDPRKNLCEQSCVNTEGSFQCACSEGYELTGKTNCESKHDTYFIPPCYVLVVQKTVPN